MKILKFSILISLMIISPKAYAMQETNDESNKGIFCGCCERLQKRLFPTYWLNHASDEEIQKLLHEASGNVDEVSLILSSLDTEKLSTSGATDFVFYDAVESIVHVSQHLTGKGAEDQVKPYFDTIFYILDDKRLEASISQDCKSNIVTRLESPELRDKNGVSLKAKIFTVWFGVALLKYKHEAGEQKKAI